MQDIFHTGLQMHHKDKSEVFKLTDEIKEGLPVYEVTMEDFSELMENFEIVENIGD